MHRSALFLVVGFGLALPVATQAQDGPRQLNTLPSLKQDTTRQGAVRQLNSQTSITEPTHQPQQATTTLPTITEVVNQMLQHRTQLPDTIRYSYSVGLKTGQVYNAYRIDTEQPFLGGPVLVLDGKQRFDLNTVRYYEDGTGFYVRAMLSDRSKHEKTLRLNALGRIKSYCITESHYNGFDRFSVYYNVSNALYFTKDDGPIKSLNLRNLLLSTTENPASTNLLLKTRRQQAYSTICYIAGGSLLLAGLVATVDPNSDSKPAISPLVYGGLPLIAIPLLIGSKKEENIQQAIVDYNLKFRPTPAAR